MSPRPWKVWAIRFAIIGLVAAFVQICCVELAMVPTASMERTVLVGDHYFLFKLPYGPSLPITSLHLPRWRHVGRGEIVAFRSPVDPQEIFLKRVVAIGGDSIEIHRAAVYVNGQKINEPYALFKKSPSSAIENISRRIVPKEELFMLGDNRDDSQDSRVWGAVPEANVIGKPLWIFWSYNAPSLDWLNTGTLHRFRFYASVGAHLLANTRWDRLGTRL